ncbi:MAG: DUF2083 domain-containing protein [Myxococcales bacterium]|nr:DUF2083 domain-containing protein [Myxococcales bacterium]
MAVSARMGAKVRSLRRRQRLTQTELADQLGISASYLNLIEHNRRPLTAPLLIKLARLFDVDVTRFAAEEDEQLASELMEAFADPLFDEHNLTAHDVRDLVTQHPAAGRAVLALYAAFVESRDQRLAKGAQPDAEGPGEALSLPSEEVSAMLQRHLNHFPGLEVVAEDIRAKARLTDDDVSRGLTAYLEGTLKVRVRVRTVQDMRGAVRRYDRTHHELWLSEVLAPRSRNFQLAHQCGLLAAREVISALVDEAPELTSDASKRLARISLANYLASAVIMPYDAFLHAARQERYDIELLGHRFRSSFEQVCHRLTTLRRPGHAGVPFHLIRVDIAGNISKRFSASGIRFARFSGACPRWNVHAAFTTPGRIRVQISEMPEGERFFCMARTVQRGAAGYHASHTVHAIGLGCRVEDAGALVYADGLDLTHGNAVRVGVSCRLCPRLDCEHRAMPPLKSPLEVDEDVRGLSFYAPASIHDP